MFVLLRKDLSIGKAFAQGIHGAIQHALDFPGEYQNDTLVVCEVDNEDELKRWMKKLSLRGYKFSTFIEPDLGDQLTSLSCTTNTNIFNNLKLWGS